MDTFISLLVVAAAVAAFIGGISLIQRSEKDKHETFGCILMTAGVVVLVLSLDSTMLITLKSWVTPMGQASVYRAPDAFISDTDEKKVTWEYPSDAHNVVWVVVSVDYLNDKPVPRESFAVMTGAFGKAPTEFTLPKSLDVETVETITVFYGNTKGPSGESVIVVNEPEDGTPASVATQSSAPPTNAGSAPQTENPPAGDPESQPSGN